MSTSSSTQAVSSDVAELKDMVRALILDRKNQTPASALVKAVVEQSCVTCGGADFVVVDFEPDPRVPLILGRCFLKTSHALIDVYEGEITLRVGKEAITFNLDQTSRYTADYNHMTTCGKAALLKVLKSTSEAIDWNSRYKGCLTQNFVSQNLMEEGLRNHLCKVRGRGCRYTVVPKKEAYNFITNDEDELIPTHLVTGWRRLRNWGSLGQRKTSIFNLTYASKDYERSKSIVYTDHSAIKYLFAKKDAKARLMRWILLLKNLTLMFETKKEAENLAAGSFFQDWKILTKIKCENKEKMKYIFLSKPLDLLL
ncbi:reverse transcriptase domain-containing protein [Tanacetum coccineum]